MKNWEIPKHEYSGRSLRSRCIPPSDEEFIRMREAFVSHYLEVQAQEMDSLEEMDEIVDLSTFPSEQPIVVDDKDEDCFIECVEMPDGKKVFQSFPLVVIDA